MQYQARSFLRFRRKLLPISSVSRFQFVTIARDKFSNFNIFIPNNRLPSTVYRLPPTVYRLPSTVYRLLSTVYLRLSTHFNTNWYFESL